MALNAGVRAKTEDDAQMVVLVYILSVSAFVVRPGAGMSGRTLHSKQLARAGPARGAGHDGGEAPRGLHAAPTGDGRCQLAVSGRGSAPLCFVLLCASPTTPRTGAARCSGRTCLHTRWSRSAYRHGVMARAEPCSL